MAVIGIDEVGRGSWAGPLVVAGVRMGTSQMTGLRDSKALSKAKRAKLKKEIIFTANDIEIVWVSALYIDQYGLSKAMIMACNSIFSSLFKPNDSIIIDGTVNFLDTVPEVKTMKKADEKIPAVAAASIIAKVSRDNYMEQISKIYTLYGFDTHVGYGTKAHLERIKHNGICAIHRKSFKPIIPYI